MPPLFKGRLLCVRRICAVVLLGMTATATVLAEFGAGDVVSMEYRTRQIGSRDDVGGVGDAGEEGATPWDQARRSQMPRYGKPATLTFTPGLPVGYSRKEKLAVAIAFAHERFVVPWMTVREAGGNQRLQKLVFTFVCATGDIVRVRSKPTYVSCDGGSRVDEGIGEEASFEIEYRWDRLPEQDEQAGISIIFTVCLMMTVFLAFDVCNSEGEDAGDSDDRARRHRRVAVGDQRRTRR